MLYIVSIHIPKHIIEYFGFYVIIISVIKVNFLELNKVFNEEFNIDGIIALKQNRGKSKHSWMENGRRSNGLLLITDHPAYFETYNGHSFKADVGDVILMTAGSRYTVDFPIPEGKRTHPLMVNFRLTNAAGEEIILPEGVFKLMRDDGSLLPLFSSAAQLYKNSRKALLKAKVFEIIGNLFPIEPYDECAIEFIGRHYTRSFSIPSLAKKCGMSEAAYRKRFKEITGTSPIRYINRLKIEKACELIVDEDFSTTYICEFLKFDSLSYFYRVFKGITGMTPNEFKANFPT